MESTERDSSPYTYATTFFCTVCVCARPCVLLTVYSAPAASISETSAEVSGDAQAGGGDNKEAKMHKRNGDENIV